MPSALALDIAPLKASRDYRLLWGGNVVSQVGAQITQVALYLQVQHITGSTAAVGLLGLVQLVPLIIASFTAGHLADTRDRRRILVVTQVGLMASSLVLTVAALTGEPALAVVYAGAALTSAFSGMDLSVRSAMTPRLVPAEQLPAAGALNQVMWNVAHVAGPLAGGLLVGRLGFTWAYGIDAMTTVATLGAALAIRPMLPDRTPEGMAASEAKGLAASLLGGLRFLRGRRVLSSIFIIDLIAMIFGLPVALFPVLAVEQFGATGGRAAEVTGILFAAIGVGALLAAVTSGWVGKVRRQGLAVVGAVILWGAAITAFALVGDRLAAAAVLLAVAGGADVVSAVFRGAILQQETPDDLRGRLSALNILVVRGGPHLGDLESGVAAALLTPAVAVVTGGLACIAGALVVAAAVPGLPRYLPPWNERPAATEGSAPPG